jgi:SAM-dependent methyltransferase
VAVALDIYEDGLRDGDAAPLLHVHFSDGTVRSLPIARWLGEPTPEEEELLDRAVAPVLDVGCGPGRHVLALRRRGLRALGVDVSPVAVALARERGAPAVEGSVFASVPGAGRWQTALLLDGNVGIGGDPSALLRRVTSVLRTEGRVLAELDPPGSPTGVESVRLELLGRRSDSFPWAHVGVDGVEALAEHAGLRIADLWEGEGRWFADLRGR